MDVKPVKKFSEVKQDASAEAWMQLCQLYTKIAEEALDDGKDSRADKFFKLANSARANAGKARVSLDASSDDGDEGLTLRELKNRSLPADLYRRAKGMADAVEAGSRN